MSSNNSQTKQKNKTILDDIADTTLNTKLNSETKYVSPLLSDSRTSLLDIPAIEISYWKEIFLCLDTTKSGSINRDEFLTIFSDQFDVDFENDELAIDNIFNVITSSKSTNEITFNDFAKYMNDRLHSDNKLDSKKSFVAAFMLMTDNNKKKQIKWFEMLNFYKKFPLTFDSEKEVEITDEMMKFCTANKTMKDWINAMKQCITHQK